LRNDLFKAKARAQLHCDRRLPIRLRQCRCNLCWRHAPRNLKEPRLKLAFESGAADRNDESCRVSNQPGGKELLSDRSGATPRHDLYHHERGVAGDGGGDSLTESINRNVANERECEDSW
jgi:hypothetical protein